MTPELISQWALEANILEPVDLLESNQWRQDTIRELKHFAALVAAHEREECARVCDFEVVRLSAIEEPRPALAAGICAAAIRARK